MNGILIEVRRRDLGKSVKAVADLTLTLPEGEITIRGLKVIQQEAREAWVAFPSNSYKDTSGQMRNFNWLEISRKLKSEIVAEVLAKYKEPEKGF